MNRYVITSTQYIYAENETELQKKVDHLERKERMKNDNHFKVESMHKIGFAEMVAVEIPIT